MMAPHSKTTIVLDTVGYEISYILQIPNLWLAAEFLKLIRQFCRIVTTYYTIILIQFTQQVITVLVLYSKSPVCWASAIKYDCKHYQTFFISRKWLAYQMNRIRQLSQAYKSVTINR